MLSRTAITRMQSIVIILVIVIAALGVGAYSMMPSQGPTTTTPKEYPTVVMGSTLGVAVNLDPGIDFQVGVEDVNSVVFDSLYGAVPGIYPDMKLEPRLASGPPVISPDLMQWTIPLRHDVKFHDGTPFNATAVKFSFDRLANLSSYSAWVLESVASVDIVDTYTVRYNLKAPNVGLTGALSTTAAAVVSPSAVQSMGDEKFGELPVGAGPFRYVEWQKGDHFTLAPFEGYWNQSRVPKVKLVYKIFADSAAMRLALEKGDIDLAWDYLGTSDYRDLLANPDFSNSIVDSHYVVWMTVNLGIPGSPLTDIRVRKAIAFSVDQKEVSEKVYRGVYPPDEDSTFVKPFYPKPSWSMYKPTNIAKAKELLTAAGYPDGIDVNLYFTPVQYGKELPDVAALLKEQLAKSGIRVTLNSVERTTFVQNFRGGNYEMALGIQGIDYPDADFTATLIAYSGGLYTKRVRLNDTTLDQLVKQGASTVDPDQRARIYGDLQDRLADMAVYVPLVYQLNYMFYKPTVLKGVLSYSFAYAQWWALEKVTQ